MNEPGKIMEIGQFSMSGFKVSYYTFTGSHAPKSDDDTNGSFIVSVVSIRLLYLLVFLQRLLIIHSSKQINEYSPSYPCHLHIIISSFCVV